MYFIVLGAQDTTWQIIQCNHISMRRTVRLVFKVSVIVLDCWNQVRTIPVVAGVSEPKVPDKYLRGRG